MRSFYILTIILSCSCLSYSQNWSTFGGNSQRDGLSKISGPLNVDTAFWSVTAPSTTLGNAVYTYGELFITSRVNFSPYTGIVECRNIHTGSLVWSSPFISNTAILYAIGFNEDGAYVHDYDTDTIYALSPTNGSIIWRSQMKSQMFGAYPGCVYACNGDLIVNGPAFTGEFTMRLDKYTGDTLWTNSEIIAIGPAVGLAATESTVYRLTGGITLPVILTAIDINTGAVKYSSLPIDGDGDQENPITIGLGGEIYFWRDGGDLHAFEDDGVSLNQKWSYIPQVTTGVSTYGNISVGPDSSVFVFDNGNLKKLDHNNGAIIDTCSVLAIEQGSVTIGKDSVVYVNDQSGNVYAFSYDLQTLLFQAPAGYYCNIPLAKDGISIFTQDGNDIIAYQRPGPLAPVADFRSDTTKTIAGIPHNFYDQSSFVPTSWQWYFPGSIVPTSTLQNPTGIMYPLAGVYPVSLVAGNASGTDSITRNCYLVVAPFTGISESDGYAFAVFPNPADEKIILIPQRDITTAVKIELADMTGKVVYIELHNNLASSLTIPVENISNGIYYLLVSGEAFRITNKIVIAH